MHILIVIDMQIDFTTGALANLDAQNKIQAMCDYIVDFQITHGSNARIIATQDTHSTKESIYLSSQEGKNLPVHHCAYNTEGWQIVPEIQLAMNHCSTPTIIQKTSFGYAEWDKIIDASTVESITLIGTVGTICVLSNAFILKALYPEIPIRTVPRLVGQIDNASEEHFKAVLSHCQVELL